MIEIQAKDEESFHFVIGELTDRDLKWKALGGNRLRVAPGTKLSSVLGLSQSPAVREVTWQETDEDTAAPISEKEKAPAAKTAKATKTSSEAG